MSKSFRTAQWALGLFLVLFESAGALAGASIVSMVGDQDALGTGVVRGGDLPRGPFDNRSPEEAAATDGSQDTDRANVGGGLSMDVRFIHTFDYDASLFTCNPTFNPIAAEWGIPTCPLIVLELGIGGLQSNDFDLFNMKREEDALFVDGMLVQTWDSTLQLFARGAFIGVNQGPVEYDVLRIVVPAYLLEQFTDGQVEVFIDTNSFGGTGNSNLTEPVFYDFSRITITNVPEPSTVWMVAAGAVLVWRTARRLPRG